MTKTLAKKAEFIENVADEKVDQSGTPASA